MLLSILREGPRRWVEAGVLAAATVLASYGAFYLGRFAYFSWRFHEVSPGVIPAPLWIPQAAMTVGAVMLAVALVDELLIVLRGGKGTYRDREDAFTLGKES
jgi:TRAP-type C4-dicarboxylate transport system permease small subunit